MTTDSSQIGKSGEESLHDDSGTDALYIALDETNDSLERKIIKTEGELTIDSISETHSPVKTLQLSHSNHSSIEKPLISEYPPPVLPSYPIPPQTSGYFPFHPMFLPAMMPRLPSYSHGFLPQLTSNIHSGIERTSEETKPGK